MVEFQKGMFVRTDWGGGRQRSVPAKNQAAAVREQLVHWAPVLATLRGGGGGGGGSSSNEAADGEGQEPKAEAEAVEPAAAGASAEAETLSERADLLPVKGQPEMFGAAGKEDEENGGRGKEQAEADSEGEEEEEEEEEEEGDEEEMMGDEADGEEEKGLIAGILMLRRVAKVCPSEELAQLIKDQSHNLVEARKTRARINMLTEWHRLGITTIAEGERYEAAKKKKEEVGGSSEGGDGGKGARGESRVDTGAPGNKHLSQAEQSLCSHLNMTPRDYLTIKHAMIQECVSSGCLKNKNISRLTTIETGHDSKEYDFFSTCGWITDKHLPTKDT